MSEQYPYLTIEQQVRIAFAHHDANVRPSRSVHYSLKNANKWVAQGRAIEDFPLLRQSTLR